MSVVVAVVLAVVFALRVIRGLTSANGLLRLPTQGLPLGALR